MCEFDMVQCRRIWACSCKSAQGAVKQRLFLHGPVPSVPSWELRFPPWNYNVPSGKSEKDSLISKATTGQKSRRRLHWFLELKSIRKMLVQDIPVTPRAQPILTDFAGFRRRGTIEDGRGNWCCVACSKLKEKNCWKRHQAKYARCVCIEHGLSMFAQDSSLRIVVPSSHTLGNWSSASSRKHFSACSTWSGKVKFRRTRVRW